MTEDQNEFLRLIKVRLDNSIKTMIIMCKQQRIAFMRKAAATGNLRSGRTFVHVAEIFSNQILIQQREILSNIDEVYKGFDFDFDTAFKNELQKFCNQTIENHKELLIQEMLSHPPFKTSGFMREDQLKKLTDMQVESIENIYVERQSLFDTDIQIKMRAIKMNKQNSRPGHTVYVDGNVGNLQVGDGNTINIINEVQKTQIIDSFNEIRNALQGTDIIEAEQYLEINEMMTQCEAELNKQKPNKTLIGATLGAVGKAISGIATVGGAYQTLQILSPLFGGPILP